MSESEDEMIDQLENLNFDPSKRNHFVSGWDAEDDLLEEDADPETTPERHLLWAVCEGKLELVKQILREQPQSVNALDSDGYTPLHRASYMNHISISEVLLLNGADVNARTSMEWTPLHSACHWGNADTVILLIQHGADVNAQTDGGQTPLHIAASRSNNRAVLMTLLMNDRIQTGLVNKCQETASQIARRYANNFELFKIKVPSLDVELGLID